MRSSGASMCRSVRPDRNGSPAAKRWAKPTPKEAITERIKGRFVERKPKENRKISLRIDLENSIKAQQSAGYEKWAKLHNLKQAARTLNFLTEHEIDSYPDLESRVAEITAASTEAAAALKAAERRLAEMAVLIKDVTTCKELHPLLQEYQRAADRKKIKKKTPPPPQKKERMEKPGAAS